MIRLDGAALTCADVVTLATGGDRAELTGEARGRIARSHAHAAALDSQRPVYGRTTGVGANRDVTIDDPAAHALALLRSHATSAGPLRAPERVRGMLAVRLNQLAAGGSGVSLEVADALAAMLAADALPPVREYGSIGTGDLAALAAVALALPVPLAAGDALALLSSNAAAVGDAALAGVALARLADVALEVAAVTFTAVDGNPEAFAPVVQRATPFRGAAEVCARMRGLVGDAAPAARLQDPFGLRTLPQVHGAFLDALAGLDRVVCAYGNAPAENPLLLPSGGVAHHGGFHAAYLAQALDAAVSAAAQSAQLGLARLAMLVEPAHTGLAPFLGDGTPGASGVMGCEYVAASALASLRALAAAAGVQSVALSRGVEDDASFASLAARQALDAVEPYRVVLGCELVAAVRALRLRGQAVPARFASLPGGMADRDLTPDLAAAGQLLQSMSSSGRSSSA